MAAGFGVLLGIFAANVLAYEKSWRVECKSMLQLFLSCLFSAILVGIGMSGSFLLPISQFKKDCRQEGKEEDIASHPSKANILRNIGRARSTIKYSNVAYEDNNKQYHDDDIELQINDEAAVITNNNRRLSSKSKDDKLHNITLGKRPNIPKFIKQTRTYCVKNNYKSVGVSVCGPDAMVDSVMNACRNESSSSSCCCFGATGNSSSSLSSSTSTTNNDYVQFVVDDEVFEW